MPSSSTDRRIGFGFALLVSLALAALFYLHYAAQPPRLAYVDTDRLLNAYQAMLDARRTYQRQKSEWEHNLQTLEQEARQAAEAVEKLPNTAPAAARARLVASAQLRQQQLITYSQAVERQDPEERQRLTEPVLAHTNQYLRRYGQRHGYDVLLSTAEAGALVYANPALDVTADVAAGLNTALRDSLKGKK
jgi:outer membrane protein